jgi:hypothetical protein
MMLEKAKNNNFVFATFNLYGSRNKKNSEQIATCTNGTIFKLDFTNNKFEGHGFAITNITNDTITFVNPWDSSVKYTMTWEEFTKLGIGMINIADSNDFEFVKNDNETETPETEVPDTEVPSNDDDDESNYISSSPRQTATKLLSDSKLPTKFSHSIQPNNTHKIINEFHRNPTPIYTKHLNNINTQSTGHHRKRTASSSLNVKQRSKAYNGTVVKAKHKLNLLYNSNTNTTNSAHSNNNIYLTQFDWMLSGNKNSIHGLSKLRVMNKRSALNNNMNALKLEQIQTNIQQNQLNLKQPHVFYSEAFKEMIHSKERNKVP